MSHNGMYEPAKMAPERTGAEEGLLACVMMLPDHYGFMFDAIKADDFFLYKHRWLWEAMTHLYENNVAINDDMIRETLLDMGRLEDIGGMVFLQFLQMGTKNYMQGVEYAARVMNAAQNRRYREFASDVLSITEDETHNWERIDIDIEERWRDLPRPRKLRGLKTFGTVTESEFDDLELAANGQLPPVKVASTTLADIDELLGGGFFPGQNVTIAARTGLGKTSFMIKMAWEMAATEHVAYFSLEMSAEELQRKIISMHTGIPVQRLRRRKLSAAEFEKYTSAVAKLSKLDDRLMFMDDAVGAITLDRIVKECEDLKKQDRLFAVFVDYLQILATDGSSRSRVEELGQITSGLKNMARRLQVPVISGAQLNRSAEEKRPTLAQLRESGSIEHDSDIVVFLWASKEDQDTKRHVEVAKNRDGAIGSVVATWRKERALLVNGADDDGNAELEYWQK